MSTPDLGELRRLLEAATPGPWRWAGNVDNGEPYIAGGCSGGFGSSSVMAIGWEPRSTTGRAADEVRSYASESDMDESEAVDMWANDQYGEPIREPRLWFYTDHMAVEARDHVTFEVAPAATTREDPAVYRADITDVRHPDAALITAAVNALPALLDDLEAAREEIATLTAQRDLADRRHERLEAVVEALAEEWADELRTGKCPDGECGGCTRGEDGNDLRALLAETTASEERA